MSEIDASKVLDAIDLIVDSKLKQANFDKTIKATIVSCTDALIGEYEVQFQDNRYYAYSENTTNHYAAGMQVYILVPNGNMSETKTIIGSVDKLGENYIPVLDEQNYYIDIGNNCVTSTQEEFGYCSYEGTQEYIIYGGDEDSLNVDNKFLSEYIKNGNALKISANFWNELNNEQKLQPGAAYGFKITVCFGDEEEFNTKKSEYYEIASREIIHASGIDGFQIPTNFSGIVITKLKEQLNEYGVPEDDARLAVGLARLYNSQVETLLASLEERVFTFDSFDMTGQPLNYAPWSYQYKFINLGELSQKFVGIKKITFFVKDFIKNNVVTKNDLFFKDFYILSQKQLSTDDIKSNFLRILTNKKGYYITNADSEISLDAELWYGSRVIDSKNLKYYWFVENPNIAPGVDGYVSDLGGRGWEQLKDEAGASLILNDEKVSKYKTQYKCSVIYEKTVFSATQEVINQVKHNYNIKLESSIQAYTKEGTFTITCSLDKIDGKDYIYKWYKTDVDGVENQLTDNTNILNVDSATLNSYVDYKCEIYEKQVADNIFIGSAKIHLARNDNPKTGYILTIENGNQVFKYDEYGISPCHEQNLDPQKIFPLTFTLKDQNGESVNTEGFLIKWTPPPKENSLIIIPGGQADNKESYTFNIANQFNINFINNNISLKVESPDKTIIAETTTNFVFLKQGMNGTNGTSLVLKIVLKQGDTIVRYATYNEDYTLDYTLYENGAAVTLTDEEKNTVKWTRMFHNKASLLADKDENDQPISLPSIRLSGQPTANTAYEHLIKAEITYKGQKIIAVYPLVVASGKLNEEIDFGFQEVMYAADGTRPQYNKNIETPIIPAVYNGYDVNYYRNITKDGILFHIPVYLHLNRYGFAHLNDWDGNSIQIKENEGYILSPQVGAGIKNDDNTFTGVLMGDIYTPSPSPDGLDTHQYGLFGYNNGEKTFSIDSETGHADFISGTIGSFTLKDSILSSGITYNEKDEPIYSNDKPNFAIDTASFSNGKHQYFIQAGGTKDSIPLFSVKKDGTLNATNADITGKITATSLTLKEGIKIGAGYITYNDMTLEMTIGSMNSQISTNTSSIEAKVSSNETSGKECSWDMDPNAGFKVTAKSEGADKATLTLNSSGLIATTTKDSDTATLTLDSGGLIIDGNVEVTGQVYATGGNLGGFYSIMDKDSKTGYLFSLNGDSKIIISSTDNANPTPNGYTGVNYNINSITCQNQDAFTVNGLKITQGIDNIIISSNDISDLNRSSVRIGMMLSSDDNGNYTSYTGCFVLGENIVLQASTGGDLNGTWRYNGQPLGTGGGGGLTASWNGSTLVLKDATATATASIVSGEE